jgi:glyoxylase-like metal-dependent hydrolase (beta-lactamase superfamily II)
MLPAQEYGRTRQALLVGLLVLASVHQDHSQVLAQQAAPVVQSVRLYVFDCGVLIRGEPTAYNLTRAEVVDTNFSDPCFLIAHPKGTLLWDVGIIPDASIPPGGIELPTGAGTNRNTATKTLRSQLAEIGYHPADITYLATSHGHADHVANANDYAAATWLVQQPERDSMFGEAAQKAAFFATYSKLRSSKTVTLTGDHDVFGDGSAVLIATPGHTPGHQSLVVTLARTGVVVLSGDLYHYPAERTLKRVPNTDYNKDQTQTSRAAIESLLLSRGGHLWIQHDMIANAALRKSPSYYD